jgi:hypothetical protein
MKRLDRNSHSACGEEHVRAGSRARRTRPRLALDGINLHASWAHRWRHSRGARVRADKTRMAVRRECERGCGTGAWGHATELVGQWLLAAETTKYNARAVNGHEQAGGVAGDGVDRVPKVLRPMKSFS